MHTYRTIEAPSEGLFKDRGSKFLAFAFPIETADDIKNPLHELRKTHIKAVHFCYAYQIGVDGNNFRANDDGEPSGSAGKPILNQIISAGLTNICVVVVRYFGGTLLGVPGLINAYRQATVEALNQAIIIQKVITQSLLLSFEYAQIGDVMKWIKQMDATIISQDMNLACDITLSLPLEKVEQFISVVEEYNIYNPAIEITKV